ncbi:protein CHAPERONE-LIKE PROTEIN OF POR1, chloroplastic [Dendrobium catenatum]|nr:protein CHAPERONE-LIKE PROTEIN OF POR1, chloroplastic [Dendrobium catenatum]
MERLFLTNPANLSSPSLLRPKPSKHKDARSACRLGTRSPRCAMDAALGGSYNYENILKFPRMHVWDPYKRLGLTRDASEEEILAARNFLLEQYAGHEGSVESIEGAFEKLLMASFRLRKKTKINLKSRLKKQVEESPPWVQRLLAYVEVPPVDTILRRLFLFAFMGGWSILNSAETGPAFQVALSLGSCIYFLNDKMNNVPRAAITGFAALAIGWIVGSTVVPMLPSVLLQQTWSLELLTSLVSYVFLFSACTFLK